VVTGRRSPPSKRESSSFLNFEAEDVRVSGRRKHVIILVKRRYASREVGRVLDESGLAKLAQWGKHWSCQKPLYVEYLRSNDRWGLHLGQLTYQSVQKDRRL
jgi:hypothetical protein